MSLPEPFSGSSSSCRSCPASEPRAPSVWRFTSSRHPREDAEHLCDAIRDVKEHVTYCSTCNNITDTDPCAFCTGATRDQRLICVVEEPQNVTVVEKTREFRGLLIRALGSVQEMSRGTEPPSQPLFPLPGRPFGRDRIPILFRCPTLRTPVRLRYPRRSCNGAPTPVGLAPHSTWRAGLHTAFPIKGILTAQLTGRGAVR